MDDSAPVMIVGLWLLFLATHTGLSSGRVRPVLTARLGTPIFLGGYSLIALAIFVPLVLVYANHKHAGAFLWYGSIYPWMRPPVYVLMAFAFTLIIGAFLDPSPASIAPGKGELRGVLRVTRHPLFMGVALLGLLHLCVARIHTADLAFFAGLPIVGLIGCWHQDQRNLASGRPEFRRFYDATAFLPFARGGLRALVERPTALIAGLIVTVVIRVLHPAIFGGA